MSADFKHITDELVEQIAIISYEQIRVRNSELPMPSWTGAGAMTRYQTKQDVSEVLKLVVPVLIEQGWTPPEETAEMRAAVDRVATLFQGMQISHGDGVTEDLNATIRATINVNTSGDDK